MTDQLEYQTEGMRQTAAQVDAQVESRIAKAEDRVMDAAQNQGEEKWGTDTLGEPIVFGRTYEMRLTELEKGIRDLVGEVEAFSRKVKEAAAKADATEEELVEIFSKKERSLAEQGGNAAQSVRQMPNAPQSAVWDN